jgi:predicted site-specific integrase-resolvase
MLTIGKVAKLTGFSTSAIRYYERQGLLHPTRLSSGYRRYDENTINPEVARAQLVVSVSAKIGSAISPPLRLRRQSPHPNTRSLRCQSARTVYF